MSTRQLRPHRCPAPLRRRLKVDFRAELSAEVPAEVPAPEGGGYVENGAVIVNFGWFNEPPLAEFEVNVEITGTPEIAVDIGITEGRMPVRSIERIIQGLRTDILPALETFIP